jgi:hypothetical protein
MLVTPRLAGMRGDCRWSRTTQSAAKVAGQPPKGALTVGAIGDVVAPGVVAQARQRLLLVQPLSVKAGDDQALDLGQGQRWGFLYSGASAKNLHFTTIYIEL